MFDVVRSINSKYDICVFFYVVLDEIGKILYLFKGGGVLCVGNEKYFDKYFKVIISIGCYRGFDGKEFSIDVFSEEV